jgi:hypothetical protein
VRHREPAPTWQSLFGEELAPRARKGCASKHWGWPLQSVHAKCFTASHRGGCRSRASERRASFLHGAGITASLGLAENLLKHLEKKALVTLSDISQISQMVGSAAVVASLIFVGAQIRQNTKATRAQSHHAVSEALNQVNLLWARNNEAAGIWLSGMDDRQALTPEDRWRFDSMLRAYLHVCETMYTQADLGAGHSGIVVAEEAGIKFVFSSDGVKGWWRENPFGFSPEFRDYIEELTGPISTGRAK